MPVTTRIPPRGRAEHKQAAAFGFTWHRGNPASVHIAARSMLPKARQSGLRWLHSNEIPKQQHASNRHCGFVAHAAPRTVLAQPGTGLQGADCAAGPSNTETVRSRRRRPVSSQASGPLLWSMK
jgi:hypothetical protein